MARNPEFSRGTSQFSEVGGQVTRRPDNHTKRKGVLGQTHVIIEGKGKGKIVENRFRDSEGQRPDRPERQHVEEGLVYHLESSAVDTSETDF